MNFRLSIMWATLFLLLVACSGSSSSSPGTDDNSPAPAVMGGAVQTPLSLSQVVSTFSGPKPGFDGTGLEAVFNWPYAVTTDGTNLYVADSGNHTIRKIVIATRAVTTLAGVAGMTGSTDGIGPAARFNYPLGITSDGTNLFVSDSNNDTIRKIEIATGMVTTLCGSPGKFGSVDGVGSAARFDAPTGIATDGTNLYVTDFVNSTIRKVVIATGAVTTIAGSAGNPGSDDGTGETARFQNPDGIVTDGINLFVTDTDNSTIRKVVIATGAVTTIAGSAGNTGHEDGAGETARFYRPKGITLNGTILYVADQSNQTIRKIDMATAVVTTLCGSAGSWGKADGIGTAAKFDGPAGITTDGTNLYIADTGNGSIRKVVIATKSVTTYAGNPSEGFTDGRGAEARFYGPLGITTDGTRLFVADAWNNAIRMINISTGAVTTLAGNGSMGALDGTGISASFDFPHGITTEGKNLYVTDQDNHTIRKVVISTGVVTTLAGSPGIEGSTDGTGTAARFNRPGGITTDGTNLYATDLYNATIRKIVIATGVVTTLAGNTGFRGWNDGTGSAASFWAPSGITTDGTNLYITDDGNHLIRKVVIATGVVTTIAGTRGVRGSTDGTGKAALFSTPRGITSDGTNLYICDYGNTIRQMAIATGVVTTISGSASNAGFADGMGSEARFNTPEGITTDGLSLYVADRENNSIRKIR